jgi:hypothetical protein
MDLRHASGRWLNVQLAKIRGVRPSKTMLNASNAPLSVNTPAATPGQGPSHSLFSGRQPERRRRSGHADGTHAHAAMPTFKRRAKALGFALTQASAIA